MELSRPQRRVLAEGVTGIEKWGASESWKGEEVETYPATEMSGLPMCLNGLSSYMKFPFQPDRLNWWTPNTPTALHGEPFLVTLAKRGLPSLELLYSQKCRLIPPVGTGICLQCRRPGFNPRVGKIPWRRKWQPTPVLLPEEFHGQRSLVDYSPWLRNSRSKLSDLHFTGNLPYTTLNYSLHILSHLP